MITWMQKHRKYLVATIWVSTIAFVGAGFVGWGSYDFDSVGSSVAKVGDVEVTKEDYSSAYSNILNYYSNMSGGKLDEQSKKALNLENATMQTLINQALLQNFAKELQIRVTDEETAQKIASMEPFLKNGKFNKEQYLMALKNAGLSPKGFESGLKKELLIEKTYSAIEPIAGNEEVLALFGALESKDNVGIKIIDAASFLKPASETDIKGYWEKNKAKFKTEPSYDLESLEITSKDIVPTEGDLQSEYAENHSLYAKDGKKQSFEEAKELIIKNTKLKIAKKEALKKYVELKEGKLVGVISKEVKLSELDSSPQEIKAELLKAKGTVTLKPILLQDNYVIIKVNKFSPSKETTFEEAKERAKIAVERERAIEDMKNAAKEALAKGFETVDAGFLSKKSQNSIPGLNDKETAELTASLFVSKEPTGAVYLPSKAVLFKVLKQERGEQKEINPKDNEQLLRIISNSKASLVNQNVLEYLRKRYEVKLYMRPNGENNSTKN